MAYILDPTKAEVRLLSNDAFFWLKDEDDPIDEDNLEEAEEILALFPNGFVIQDKWTYVDNDTIEATFIPYIEDKNSVQWDGEFRLTLKDGKPDMWGFAFKIIDSNTCYARWFNDVTGKYLFEGECEVKHIFNNPWAIVPKNNQIPLWGKQTKYFTSNRF